MGGGGSQLGGHSEQFNVFGGQEENVSDKENSPGPPVTLQMKGPLEDTKWQS